MVYLTSSSMQSTSRSRLELGIMRLPSSSTLNCVYALGTELWFGMVNMRIQRPRMRSELTALKDCEPPLTWATASVLPWVGRTAPDDSGIQSICCLNMPVYEPVSRLAVFRHFARRSRIRQRTYEISMLFRADPNVTVAPLAQLSQLLHFRVQMCNVVLLG